MEKTDILLKVAKEGKWEEVESLWMEILEGKIETLEPFKEIAHELSRRGQDHRTKDLIQMTCAACSELEPTLWIDALRMSLKYKVKNKDFVEDYANAFKRQYKDLPYLAGWIDLLMGQKIPTSQFVDILDRLVMFREGTIVKHRSGWGIGVVTEVGHEKMEIFVNLQHKPNHRMDTLAAADCLIPLAPDNFEAMMVLRPDALAKEAEERPLELMYKLLKFTDKPTHSKDIKKYLCPKVVNEKQWSKWWTKLRKDMIADPYIEASTGAQGKYALRDKPRDWDEEFKVDFDQADELNHPPMIIDYLKKSPSKSEINYFTQKLSEESFKHLKSKHPWYALECVLVVQECVKEGAQDVSCPNLQEIFAEDPVEIYAQLRILSLAQQTLEHFQEQVPDWKEHIKILFRKGSDLARDTLFRYLKKNKNLHFHLLEICEDIIKNRLSSPDAILWLSKQILNNRFIKGDVVPSLLKTYQMMVQTTNNLKSIGRWDVKKAGRIFTLAIAEKVCEFIDEENAVETLSITKKASWLSSVFRESMKVAIEEKFPKLFSEVEPLYTTEAGLAKYEEEYRDLMDNKIPANSEAIGRALEFGDLSENAELDAAREVQVQLTKKAKAMQENMERVVLIDTSLTPDNEVGIGSVVKLQNPQGALSEYTILGPWDMDLENGIISYMSPIARALMGSTVNNKVKLPNGEFKIAGISKYNA